ncbi:hypothetical protein ATY81_03345 [Rhizobium sp. R72]|uniref:hypothetical protein n=1 Tax=unclassified Rhizobium TaxID=2613769 RepID=UPI000B532CE8|nr:MULTISPECIES: hypothetical protein [unclassified Rhizobium]OWV96345.1 hypothetical protein ATY79_03950 [Rhizobium sp. R693]OWW05010.1 hypothetical protein ATY81_03345 [Rhizobium sp. R72]OWW06067.1 hypothetical protein ATY80_03345 [Rhizobium sp. R711]
MIALTATTLGFVTAPMRSIFSMVLVGFLVCAVYACAAWVSTTSILDLTAAIGCYDSGLLICLLGLYTLDRVRDRRRFV